MNIPNEQWRPSPTLPEYIVSNLGRVMRIPTFGEMPNGGVRAYGGQPWAGADGGQGRLTIQYNGTTYKVHRLVCEAFNGPAPDGAVCMHLNEDYTDNRPENLAWGTQKENLNAPGFIAYCKRRTGENSPVIKGRRGKE